MNRPGSWLRAFAVLVCRSSTVERLIDPIISDLRIEYAGALESSWRRRGVLLKSYAAFWKALGLHTALVIAKRGEAGDRAVFRRAVAFSCLGFALVTVLMVVPPLVADLPAMTSRAWQLMLALTLIPQALPLSIPIGVCIGIMSAIRARALTRRDVFLTLTIGCTATCLVWAVIEWGLPWGNQRFREMTIAAVTDGRVVHIEPGVNELGFSGLAHRTDAAAVRHYQLLWALTFAAIPLALFTLGMAARVRQTVVRALLILVTLFAYYAVLLVSHSALRQGAPMVIAWAPNAVFLAVGSLLLWRQHKIAAV